ncbi:MAG: hypothetical protein DRN95_07625 [Candidatus Hydrothermarchaeota archaeon]|nr:MAG: hypothetical protein DRN95_07625 [Candidatus Hydrothermarchaeota archaeon]
MNLDECRADAAMRFKVSPEDLAYYTFPETFGSTSGPSGRPGGQQMTTFQIDAFESPLTGKSCIYCGGRFWKIARVEVYIT